MLFTFTFKSAFCRHFKRDDIGNKNYRVMYYSIFNYMKVFLVIIFFTDTLTFPKHESHLGQALDKK